MLAINRWCGECHGCRCGSASCPPGTRCSCPSGVRHVPAFGTMAAGDVSPHDADEDAQPERDAAPGYGPWVTPTLPSGTTVERATPHDCERNVDDHPATLAAQVAALGPWIATAASEMAFTDVEHGLALSRLVEGYDMYGSELFTMPDAELDRNLAEEYADALVYRAEQLRRIYLCAAKSEAAS